MAKTAISKDRERMLNGAIAYLRFKGYHEIKTTIKGFPPPQAIFRKASEAGYVPDMIAEKDFGTFIFELLDQDSLDNWDDRLTKWEMFQEYVTRKSGKFYFIAYSDQCEEISERIEKLDFTPGIVRINR